MKHIDLEKILQKYSCNGMREMTDERIKDCMREACEQTVDLCAERYRNANIGENEISILNVKTQIK